MVARELEAPHTLSITLQRMKSPARDRIELRDILGFLDRSQHGTKLLLILPRGASYLVLSPESLNFPITKTDDTHIYMYAVTVRLSI